MTPGALLFPARRESPDDDSGPVAAWSGDLLVGKGATSP